MKMLNTCRICLRTDDSIVTNIDKYIELIKKIAQIELILNEQYPRKICRDCSNDLLNADVLCEMLLECNNVVEESFMDVEKEILINDAIKNLENKEFVDYIKLETTEVTQSLPKKKQESVKVVLREKGRQLHSPSLILSRNLSYRTPVKEVYAGSLKKESNYECHYCNTPQLNLDTHILNTHPNEPLIFRCRFCENTYKKFASLKDHVYKAHKLNRNIPCDECDMYFSLPCRLKEHKIKAHSDERNFVCNFCTARFKLRSNLKLHMRVHSGEKRYKCEFCEKAYAHYSDWKTHHMAHTGHWKYHCEVCNKGFYKPSALKMHLKTHLIS